MNEFIVSLCYNSPKSAEIYNYFHKMYYDSEVATKWNRGEETLYFDPDIEITMINTSVGSFIKEVLYEALRFEFEWDKSKVSSVKVSHRNPKDRTTEIDTEFTTFLLKYK